MSEFVEDLHNRIVEGLTTKLGIGQHTAGMLATELIAGMCDAWAGCEPYIGKANNHGERNRAIIRDFKKGERVPLLARRYNLSRVRVWQIVKG